MSSVTRQCTDCREFREMKARGRCGSCYARWLRRQKAYGRDVLVDVVESGVRERVLGLMRDGSEGSDEGVGGAEGAGGRGIAGRPGSGCGFSPRDVAQLTGLSVMVIQKIYRDDDQQVQRVSRETARAVMSVKPAEQWGRGEIERTKIRLATATATATADGSSGVGTGAASVASDAQKPQGLRRGTPRGRRIVRAEGSTRRLQALAVSGWSREYLSQWSDLDQWNVIGPIMRGRETAGVGSRAARQLTRAETALAIIEMYDALSMKNPREYDGGSGYDAKTARDAVRRGWLPVLAWDDDNEHEGRGCIDDPWEGASPKREGRVKTKSRMISEMGHEKISERGEKAKMR